MVEDRAIVTMAN